MVVFWTSGFILYQFISINPPAPLRPSFPLSVILILSHLFPWGLASPVLLSQTYSVSPCCMLIFLCLQTHFLHLYLKQGKSTIHCCPLALLFPIVYTPKIKIFLCTVKDTLTVSSIHSTRSQIVISKRYRISDL